MPQDPSLVLAIVVVALFSFCGLCGIMGWCFGRIVKGSPYTPSALPTGV